MPSLARGQENTPEILNWFVRQNGVLIDQYEIGFQIWDLSGGAPGTLVYPNPADPSEWEDVTSGTGHFGTGSYYAYNNDDSVGWTPDLGEPLGEHWVKWRWKPTASSQYREDQEAFTVLVESGGSTTNEYVTVQQVRDAGLPLEADGGPSDARVLYLIQLYSNLIDKVTRCFFNSRSLTLYLDGLGHESLFLPFPVISVSTLEINLVQGSGDPMSDDDFRVYNRDLRTDKMVPRVTLVRERQNIFSGVSSGLFEVGHQNQKISGLFGWLEDGGVPVPIQEAVIRLVVKNAGNVATGAGGGAVGGWGGRGSATVPFGVTQEKADKHSISYTDLVGPLVKAADATALQLINDPIAYSLIMQYRIKTPAVGWSSRNRERAMMSS